MRTTGLMAVAAATLVMVSASMARADDEAAQGKKIFSRTCAACHTDQANGPKRLGPTLFGVVGRKAGSVEGFHYSEANKKSGITWTPDVLDKYLTDPRALVPGTLMAFAGLKKQDDRKDVIAYLETLK